MDWLNLRFLLGLGTDKTSTIEIKTATMNPSKIFLMCNLSAWVGSGVKHAQENNTRIESVCKPFRLRLRCVKCLFGWLVGRYLKIPSTLSFLQEAHIFHDTVFMLQDG